MEKSQAVFGAGCFWCVEAIFKELKGVEQVESGYSGGEIKNPSYKEVCMGITGHAEVVRVTFDPVSISYQKLLEVFFQAHDPTTLNRQGADVGTQYRSVIFYQNDFQKEAAEKAINAANASGIWSDRVVTSVEPLNNYYPAEDNHQDYYSQHSDQPYCNLVIRPKMDKFRAKFKELLKTG